MPESGGVGEIVDELASAWATFERNRNNSTRAESALNEIDALIQALKHDGDTWRELGAWMDRKTKYVETKRRQMFVDRLMISSEEMMSLLSSVVFIVKQATELQFLQAAVKAGDPSVVWNQISDGLQPLLQRSIEVEPIRGGK